MNVSHVEVEINLIVLKDIYGSNFTDYSPIIIIILIKMADSPLLVV